MPGTILEMPKGCTNSRYVVAKDMTISSDQSLPPHLSKRNLVSRPVVYNLTFDYEWLRVPRDLGDTQLRVDYSNEVVSVLLGSVRSLKTDFSRATGTILLKKRLV